MRFASCVALTASLMLSLASCVSETPTAIAPELPAVPTLPALYRNAAFTLAVNAVRRQVTVSAPAAGLASPVVNPSLLGATAVQPSLLGGEAIEIVATNYASGAVGEVVPGKIQVTFDLQLINRLTTIGLVTSTFPTPPSGVTGVLAFPIEITVVNSSGGVSSNGNELVVSSPRFGRVVHSNDWNGDLHNFFNDAGCASLATSCFRYEPFGALEPLSSSESRRVGFLIDPEVGDFRVKVIIAADLVAAAPPAPGTVRGTVTSNLGPLEGAVVTVTGGGSATTSATGAYSLSNVPSGNARTVTLQALPSGCVAQQPSASLDIASGATVTRDFVASCTVPTAPIQGGITNTLGAPMAGVQVTVTPTGGTALPAVATDGDGAWQVASVPYRPSNSGSITLTNLPAGCSAGSASYSALDATGLTRNLVVTCTATPMAYPLSATWGSITPTGATGRQVTLTLAIDMGVAPGNSDIDGSAADALTGLSLVIGYDGTVLDWTSRQLLTPASFDIGEVVENNAASSGAASAINIGSSTGATRSGVVDLVRLTFNVTTGASGTVTPVITLTRVGAGSLDVDVTSRVTLSVPGVVIP